MLLQQDQTNPTLTSMWCRGAGNRFYKFSLDVPPCKQDFVLFSQNQLSCNFLEVFGLHTFPPCLQLRLHKQRLLNFEDNSKSLTHRFITPFKTGTSKILNINVFQDISR